LQSKLIDNQIIIYKVIKLLKIRGMEKQKKWIKRYRKCPRKWRFIKNKKVSK